MWWHRLLLFLRIRNKFDWAFPGWPEVNHPYMPHSSLRCCEHCGGGRFNWIHRPPYDPRRVAEILADEQAGLIPEIDWPVNESKRVHLERGR
jgi:hypothetical protein